MTRRSIAFVQVFEVMDPRVKPGGDEQSELME
jgi:hypothetical protein